jgi:rhamnogalacturonyl hydrolase YesR
MKIAIKILGLLLFFNVGVACNEPKKETNIDDDHQIENDYMEWAQATLNIIDRDLKITGSDAYYEDQNRSYISYIWGNIFLLYAYVEGVKLDATTWSPYLDKCITNCEKYWTTNYNNKDGYATLPVAQGNAPDRYYDENGWMAIGLCDAYAATGNSSYLDKAKAALAFTLSGEDNVFGGGIYFQETFTLFEPQKNTICCAVAILASMKIYETTREQQYLEHAQRINEWVVKTLLDKADNLFWDAKIVSNGSINRNKWSYNAGFMIRAWIKLYEATDDDTYLRQAKATLTAAEIKWFNAQTGALKDPGYFAFTLIDSWYDMYDITKDKQYLLNAFKAVDFIYNKLRDTNGRYPEYWSTPVTSVLTAWDLRYFTVVAYTFMRAEVYKEKFNNN